MGTLPSEQAIGHSTPLRQRANVGVEMDEVLQATISVLKALSAVTTGLGVIGLAGRLAVLVSRWLTH